MIDAQSLQKYSFFGGLLPSQIECVRALLGSESFSAGEDIMVEGRCNDRIYFIVEGRVLVSKAGKPLIEIGEGETFGEMEVLDVMPAAATVTALGPVSLATLSNRSLHALSGADIRAFAIVVMNFARDLSRRLRRMDEFAAEGRAARVD